MTISNHGLVELLPRNCPRIGVEHLSDALRIVESVFETRTDPTQIQIQDESVKWTIQNTPTFWKLIVSNGSCVGSAAVLPTTISQMVRSFPEISTKPPSMRPRKWTLLRRRLYLAGVTLLSRFQRQGLGTKAPIHTIEAALVQDARIQELYCWPYSQEGEELVRKVESLKGWNIQTRRT